MLEAEPSRPDRFVARLVSRDDGRALGLYFLVATVDAPRQTFLLGSADGGDERFVAPAAQFARCYGTDLAAWPFSIRDGDAALLLHEIDLLPDGELAGPVWRRLEEREALAGAALGRVAEALPVIRTLMDARPDDLGPARAAVAQWRAAVGR